jgi:phosphopantetheine adenylyltransferase
LTRETEKGGIMINNKRAENKLPPMNMVFVDMVLANVNEKGEGQYSNKVSSTNIRKFIAENK